MDLIRFLHQTERSTAEISIWLWLECRYDRRNVEYTVDKPPIYIYIYRIIDSTICMDILDRVSYKRIIDEIFVKLYIYIVENHTGK